SASRCSRTRLIRISVPVSRSSGGSTSASPRRLSALTAPSSVWTSRRPASRRSWRACCRRARTAGRREPLRTLYGQAHQSAGPRQLGISRTTLYKLIDQGKVSATADGFIDETKLVRAAPYVDTPREHVRTRVDTVDSTAMDTHSGDHGYDDRVHEHVHEY